MLQQPERIREVQDAYPLTPMQQGLLFHGLFEPESGVYVHQIVFTTTLSDLDAYERAWQAVMERHSILRSAFLWEKVKKPLQVVGRNVNIPIDRQDWSGLSAAEVESRTSALLGADRARTLKLSRAPLMRLMVARLSGDRFRIVWTFHHLILDGWSLALVLDEVARCYDAFRGGTDPALQPTRPYADYVSWLRRQDPDRARAFWETALAGVTGPTRLGREVEVEAESAAEMHGTASVMLSADAADALRSLARARRVTVNTLLQSAWAILLGRYSGLDDVIFGAVCAGRTPELEGILSMVGLFVNTLPMRVRLDERRTLADFVSALHAQQTEMREYEWSPLTDIQGWTEVPRGTPLYESVFAFENYPAGQPADALEDEGQLGDVYCIDRLSFPLSVLVSPRVAPRLQIKMEYDERRFDEARINTLLSHFCTLLEAIPAGIDRPVGELPMLTNEERCQVTDLWNRTGRVWPDEIPVPTLVEALAAEDAAAMAVVDGDRRLAYGELNAWANQLAHRLCALAVRAEEPVAICLRPSPEMIVAKLAVMKAGGAYVPLDPTYPRERLAFMLKDCGTRVLLTDGASAELAPSEDLEVVRVDVEADANAPAHDPGIAIDADQLAYVIYTSGSTGRPKGVQVPHRGLLNLVNWHQRAYEVVPSDRATQIASVGFDACVWELWPYLTCGASVYVADEEARLMPERLWSWLASERITIAFVPTPLAEAALREALPADLSLRALLTGGDRLQRGVSDPLPFILVNHYGPTENTVVATCGDVDDRTPPPIGRPIDNVRVYVLGRGLELVPIGSPGELYVGGESLARGYLGQPALTAERFVPDPFGAGPGARLYRTGDLVRYLRDGSLEFLGRNDQQVKVRGFRIELGEIEALLMEHEDVRQAVAMVREDRAGDRRLVVYVVPTNGASLGTSEVRGFLKDRLPQHMVPPLIVMLESIPLTTHGKIDRRSLPDPDWYRSYDQQRYVAPRTPIEEQLIEVWSEVLGVDRMGVEDDFFDLGGHSLLATQVFSRLRHAFPVKISLRDLFEAPTVARMASTLDRLLVEKLEGMTDETAEALVRQGAPENQPASETPAV